MPYYPNKLLPGNFLPERLFRSLETASILLLLINQFDSKSRCIPNAKPHKNPNPRSLYSSKERRRLARTVAMGTRPLLDTRRAPLPTGTGTGSEMRQLTKLLVNVTVERSVGPMHVIVSPEDTVACLVRAAVEMYVKEGRRPLLLKTDPRDFDMHYDQYSLEREPSVHDYFLNLFVCYDNYRSTKYLLTCDIPYRFSFDLARTF